MIQAFTGIDNASAVKIVETHPGGDSLSVGVRVCAPKRGQVL